jgi:hypothetical protein
MFDFARVKFLAESGAVLPRRLKIRFNGATVEDDPINLETVIGAGSAAVKISATGTINDLSTQGASLLVFTGATAKTLTSMVASTVPVQILNKGAGQLSIANNTGGTAANRITPVPAAQIDLPQGGSALAYYDTTDSRWVLVNTSGTAQAITPALLGLTWYRPDSGNVTLATGISQLTPQNGAINLTQATTGRQPVYNAADGAFNGRPTIQFDGVDDCLIHVGALMNVRPFSAFWVGSYTGGAGDYVCTQYFATSYIALNWTAGPAIYWQEGTVSAGASHAGYPAMFAITADSGTGIIYYRNGVQIGTASRAVTAAGAGSEFSIGAGNTAGAGAMAGKIADFGFKSGVLTAAEISSLYSGYVTPRYGF